MFVRLLLTNERTTHDHGGRSEMIDCIDELTSDCLYQSSDKHRRRDNLQGHWVDAKDARAGRDHDAGEC
jgi:hypothetical protein